MKIRSNSIDKGISYLTNNKWYEIVEEFTYDEAKVISSGISFSCNGTKVIVDDTGNEIHIHLTDSYFLGGGDWEIMERDDED